MLIKNTKNIKLLLILAHNFIEKNYLFQTITIRKMISKSKSKNKKWKIKNII